MNVPALLLVSRIEGTSDSKRSGCRSLYHIVWPAYQCLTSSFFHPWLYFRFSSFSISSLAFTLHFSFPVERPSHEMSSSFIRVLFPLVTLSLLALAAPVPIQNRAACSDVMVCDQLFCNERPVFIILPRLHPRSSLLVEPQKPLPLGL